MAGGATCTAGYTDACAYRCRFAGCTHRHRNCRTKTVDGSVNKKATSKLIALVAVLPCTNRRTFGIINGIQT